MQHSHLTTKLKRPDTASTISVVGITGGVLLILGAAYAMAVKSGIDPLGIYLKESKAILQEEKAAKAKNKK